MERGQRRDDDVGLFKFQKVAPSFHSLAYCCRFILVRRKSKNLSPSRGSLSLFLSPVRFLSIGSSDDDRTATVIELGSAAVGEQQQENNKNDDEMGGKG